MNSGSTVKAEQRVPFKNELSMGNWFMAILKSNVLNVILKAQMTHGIKSIVGRKGDEFRSTRMSSSPLMILLTSPTNWVDL